jgi:hypothetical protein
MKADQARPAASSGRFKARGDGCVGWKRASERARERGRRWKKGRGGEGQWLLRTAQEETPIGGLQTPKVAIIAQSGGDATVHSLYLPMPASNTQVRVVGSEEMRGEE